jgi:Membrane transport protein
LIERILGIILPVFSVIVLGYVYARRVNPDMEWVNRLNMNVLAPALIFSALASKAFDLSSNALLIAGSVGVVLGSGLLAWPVARLLRENPRTFVPPMMFNNCGNMGLPLAVLAFGAGGLSAMVAMFTVSNLLHFTLGMHIVDRHAAFWPVLKNPMVIATFVGFGFAIGQPPMPDWLMLAIKMVGDAMIPLMLISLGRGARVPAHRHRDGGAAYARIGPGRDTARPSGSFRLPAAGSAEFHGRRAVSAGAGESRVDRPDRQPALARVRPAGFVARTALAGATAIGAALGFASARPRRNPTAGSDRNG